MVLEPGQVESVELDLSRTLEKIQEVLLRNPTSSNSAHGGTGHRTHDHIPVPDHC